VEPHHFDQAMVYVWFADTPAAVAEAATLIDDTSPGKTPNVGVIEGIDLGTADVDLKDHVSNEEKKGISVDMSRNVKLGPEWTNFEAVATKEGYKSAIQDYLVDTESNTKAQTAQVVLVLLKKGEGGL